LASLSIISNFLVLTAVLRTRSLQHPSLLLLCSLSITDVLWAIFSIVNDTKTLMHEEFCSGKSVSQSASQPASQPASQSVSQSVSQPASQPVSQSVSQLAV